MVNNFMFSLTVHKLSDTKQPQEQVRSKAELKEETELHTMLASLSKFKLANQQIAKIIKVTLL